MKRINKQWFIKQVNNTGSDFFTADTMRFFGDTVKNYTVAFDNDKKIYILSRINPVNHGLSNSAYFDVNFKRISSPYN